jgi:hypothetical protein
MSNAVFVYTTQYKDGERLLKELWGGLHMFIVVKIVYTNKGIR